MKLPSFILLILATGFFASCAKTPPKPDPETPNPEQVKVEKAGFVNPHPEGTYKHFLAEPNYPKTSRTYRNTSLLSKTNSGNSKILISLSKQRAFLMNGGEIAMDYPISSGKKRYPTPTGEFRIVEKIEDKRSNIYGKIYDASGKLVKGDADMKEDKVPEGGKYVGAPMPYWMRLTWDGIGHHVGRVPRYAASHGCIRGQRGIMPTIFEKTKVGTKVSVVD